MILLMLAFFFFLIKILIIKYEYILTNFIIKYKMYC